MKAESVLNEIPQVLKVITCPCVMTESVIVEINTCGMMCPLPLLKAKQALRDMAVGEVLRVLATDAGSLKDFVSFAQITGQIIQGFYAESGVYYYLICKR